jgi:hypothetical protein
MKVINMKKDNKNPALLVSGAVSWLRHLLQGKSTYPPLLVLG